MDRGELAMKRHERGMTLVEVTVSLMVLGVALTAMLVHALLIRGR